MTLGFLILSRKQVKSDMERVNRTIPGILSGRQGGFAAPLGALLLFQEILFYLIACERPPRQGSKFSEFVSDQIVTHHKKSTSKEKSHEWPNFSFLHRTQLHLGLRYFTTHWGTHFENTREIWSSNKIFRTFDWNLISAKQWEKNIFFSDVYSLRNSLLIQEFSLKILIQSNEILKHNRLDWLSWYNFFIIN